SRGSVAASGKNGLMKTIKTVAPTLGWWIGPYKLLLRLCANISLNFRALNITYTYRHPLKHPPFWRAS
ncbi:hypothetical protein HU740_026630, partial [Pseudomonas sp. SWRI144]|uniref:hypothetical protein n=1 Tax=Pseudomonas sp. SWRI144 TaxID=2745517 RepID=UPI001AECBCE3